MSKELDLKQVELKAWTTIFQDGLYDIFLGWLLLWMGVMSVLSDTKLPELVLTAINIGTYILSVLTLYLAKRFITTPRIGSVHFGRRRMTKVAITGLITFLIVITANILTILAIQRDQSLLGESPSPLTAPLLLSLFFLLLLGLPAFFLNYKRLFFIAVLFAIFPISEATFQEFWDIDLGILSYAAPAAVVMTIGLVVLFRFLKSHPLPNIPAGEMDHEGG